MGMSSGSGMFFVVFLIFLPIFFLPTIIAFRKNHHQKVAIAIVNVIGGLFYGIGWLIALVWSLIEPREDSPVARSVASDIRELHELKEKGILSEEEFDAKKRALLDISPG